MSLESITAQVAVELLKEALLSELRTERRPEQHRRIRGRVLLALGFRNTWENGELMRAVFNLLREEGKVVLDGNEWTVPK